MNWKFLLLFCFLFCNLFNGYSQELSQDEKARKVAMVKYLEPMQFVYETVEGDAMANMIVFNFQQTLTVLELDLKNISENDKVKLLALKFALNKLKDGDAPNWNDLLKLEQKWLLEQDKALSRTSRYKTSLK